MRSPQPRFTRKFLNPLVSLSRPRFSVPHWTNRRILWFPPHRGHPMGLTGAGLESYGILLSAVAAGLGLCWHGRDLVDLEIPASFETFLPAPKRPFSLTGGRPRLFTSQLRDPRAVSFFTFLGDGYFLSPIVKPQSVDRDRRSITPRSWRLYNVPRAKGNRPVQYHMEMESQDNFLPCPRTDPCFSATVHELLFQDGGASSAWNTSRTCPLLISSMWGTDATPLQS